MMKRPPQVVLAETAELTPSQLGFRRSNRPTLDFALPEGVWLDHRYSVLHHEKQRPVARNGRERWFDHTQAVKRAVNPRVPRKVLVLSGGTMSRIGPGRRR